MKERPDMKTTINGAGPMRCWLVLNKEGESHMKRVLVAGATGYLGGYVAI